MIRVVSAPLAKGRQERLAHQVVSRLVADPTGEVAVDVRGVAIEHDREPLGLDERTLDHGRVVRHRPGIGPDHHGVVVVLSDLRLMSRPPNSCAPCMSYPQEPPNEFTAASSP